MKDFAGNELEVGQKVICLTAGRSTSWMIWGTVAGFTPQKVRLKVKQSWSNGEELTLRDPKNVVLPYSSPKSIIDEFLDGDIPTWD